MEATPLWHVLVMDWTSVENTPPAARRPLELQRWHFRVERLARIVDRPVSELSTELKEAAKDEALRRRHEMEAELAEDLAVCQALGKPVNPPWRRRLEVLAEISGEDCDVVEERVIASSARIQVVKAN
jgi:hypothetical protein